MSDKQKMGVYLGFPMEVDGRSFADIKGIVEKLEQKIMSWKHIILNQAGKIVLINAILMAMASHVISIYLLPKYLLKKISALTMRFF